MMVSLLSGKLILRRYCLKDNRMKLDTFNNPRKQVDGPMKPHHLGAAYRTWIKLSRRQMRHGKGPERRTAAFTDGGKAGKGHGSCLRMSKWLRHDGKKRASGEIGGGRKGKSA